MLNYLVFFFCATQIRSTRQKNFILKALIIESFPLMVYGFWLVHRYSYVEDLLLSPAPFSIFYNSNHYAYFLCMVIAVCASMLLFSKTREEQIFFLIGLTINSVTLVANNTLGSWIAALMALIFLFLVTRIIDSPRSKGSALIIVLFLVITAITDIWTHTIATSLHYMIQDLLCAIFPLQFGTMTQEEIDHMGSGRWLLWKTTIKYIVKKPLLGYGAEGIDEMLLKEAGNMSTHNEFLMYAAFFGIPASILYTLGCTSAYIKAYANRLAMHREEVAGLAGAFAYLVSSVFGNMYFYTTPFFFILLGIGVSHCTVAQDHSQTRAKSL